MWIQREIETTLSDLASKRPAIILTGCRQAGKTSLLKNIFREHNYISLDVPLIAQEAEESGQLFLKQYPSPLIIDEVQYAPKLFRFLKQAIDERRELNGQYCLTGSQKFPLMEKVTESLVGRVAILECYSLSTHELEKWSQKKAEGDQLLEWIFKGGYPELHAKSLDPNQFYSDYVSTYLERDVRQILNVRSLRDFNRFMKLCSLRCGQLIDLSSFSSDIGVSPNTVKSWFSLLETSNIICLLEPYYKNLGKRIVKSPKLYFLDTGLACYLAGIQSAKDLRSSGLLGAFFETHALAQVVRWHTNQGKKPSIYFYRDHSGHEVDFMIPMGEKFRLFECKWSDSGLSMPKGFLEIEKLVGEKSIISKSIITADRGSHFIAKNNLYIEDSIELKTLN